jgi:hypothetical protein
MECGDTAPPFTNEDSSPITPLDHPTPVNSSAPERDSISTHPPPDADPSANVGAQDEYARHSDGDTVPCVETESAPSVPQAFLPVADLRDTTATALEHLTPLESDCENEGPLATTTAVLKRSDILQSQLSTHPTTITDRILSDLRDHNSPIDRALAELLSAQMNGTLEPDSADEITLNETEFTTEVQDLNEYQQQTNDSDNTDQSLNQNHVHHSDESNKELP